MAGGEHGCRVLLVVEHDRRNLSSSSWGAIAAANRLIATSGGSVEVLVAGHTCQPAALAASMMMGVDAVWWADHPVLEDGLTDNLAALVVQLVRGAEPVFSHLVVPATTFGRPLLPRVAALLGVAPVTEVVAVVEAGVFLRPVQAGHLLAEVHAGDSLITMTVRPSAFAPLAGSRTTPAPIQSVAGGETTRLSRCLGRSRSERTRPDLAAARIVVAGGLGLGEPENFVWLERLADRLGGAVGASRAAVEAGLAAPEHQVGQTGRIIGPELYIAVGISGAIQHLAGIKDARVIMAINPDAQAPIFAVADYRIPRDWREVIPPLLEQLHSV